MVSIQNRLLALWPDLGRRSACQMYAAFRQRPISTGGDTYLLAPEPSVLFNSLLCHSDHPPDRGHDDLRLFGLDHVIAALRNDQFAARRKGG